MALPTLETEATYATSSRQPQHDSSTPQLLGKVQEPTNHGAQERADTSANGKQDRNLWQINGNLFSRQRLENACSSDAHSNKYKGKRPADTNRLNCPPFVENVESINTEIDIRSTSRCGQAPKRSPVNRSNGDRCTSKLQDYEQGDQLLDLTDEVIPEVEAEGQKKGQVEIERPCNAAEEERKRVEFRRRMDYLAGDIQPLGAIDDSRMHTVFLDTEESRRIIAGRQWYEDQKEYKPKSSQDLIKDARNRAMYFLNGIEESKAYEERQIVLAQSQHDDEDWLQWLEK